MRRQEVTGTNNVPVAPGRRFGNRDLQADLRPTPPATPVSKQIKKEFSDFVKQEPFTPGPTPVKRSWVDKEEFFDVSAKDEEPRGRSLEVKREATDHDSARKRKRGNRWGASAETNSIAGLVGLPTMISSQMTNEQLDAYCVHLRILEITQKLKINDIVPAERLR